MENIAFTTSVAVQAARPLPGRGLSVRRPTDTKLKTAAPKMSTAADRFQYRSQTREAKEAVSSTGVYTVQCTEGTSKSATTEDSRMSGLARDYRLRQASLSQRYADLFATRRAAIVQTFGSHTMESYVVRFPARASASVAGRAEAQGACSRYYGVEGDGQEYMYKCVDNQYKALRVPHGEFSTMCADGREKSQAEASRIISLAAQFRGSQFTTLQKTQMRYNAIKEATILASGCDYEEAYFQKFPKMAAAMRYSDGTYASSVNETALLTGGNTLTVAEQIEGVNLDVFWPSNLIRPAVDREVPWYATQLNLKKYTPMSEAAVEWGVSFQNTDDEPSPYVGAVWHPGWQPVSKALRPFEP